MRIPSGQAGGGGSSGSGWVYVADIDPTGSGVVTGRTWQDAGNTVLQTATTSTVDIDVTVRASYPLVTVNGSDVTLSQSGDGGHYEGVASITITGSGSVSVTVQTPNDQAGAADSVVLTLDAPPQILTLSFTGSYPGAQNELKEGDTFQITGTTDKAIDQVEIQNYEACQFAQVVVSGTSFTVSGTIADRGNSAVLRPARVRARDASTGAFSNTRDTNFGGGSIDGVDVVNVNDFGFETTFGSPTYPPTQQAIKGSESATIPSTNDFAVSAGNTIVYDDNGTGELTVTNPNTAEPTKTVTRAGGTYNIASDNLRVVMFRAANAKTTQDTAVVNIADTAAPITVSYSGARLRSGGNDGTSIQSHTITISSSQLLLSAAMDEDVGGGTFIGSWSGSPPDSTWTRTIQVHDDDVKGTYNWQNLVVTNLAGVVTNTITTGASYVLGGFVARDGTFAPFATTLAFNVMVTDFSKVTAVNLTGSPGSSALKQSIGTSPPIVDGYTIQATGVKPVTVIWLDTVAAGNNSTGTAQIIGFEETT